MFGKTTQNSPEHIALISAGRRAAAARIKSGEGFMYVAAIKGTDAVKIGFSLRPERRVGQFGPRARLLGYFPASVKAERGFHADFRDHRHPDFPGQEVYRRAAFFAQASVA